MAELSEKIDPVLLEAGLQSSELRADHALGHASPAASDAWAPKPRPPFPSHLLDPQGGDPHICYSLAQDPGVPDFELLKEDVLHEQRPQAALPRPLRSLDRLHRLF